MAARERLVFFDFVTDQVRSRAVQVLGVLFVVQLVFFLVGSKVLVDPRSTSPSTVTRVDLFQLPSGAEIGAPLKNQPQVRVLHDNVPVEGCWVQLRVASIQTQLLRETLVCEEGRYASFLEHSAAREAICGAAFDGQVAARPSNLCGVVDFNVSIAAGIVALYELEFVAQGPNDVGLPQKQDSLVPRATAFVRTITSVSEIAVVSTLPKVVRTQVPQGSVRVTVTGGAVGATVFLICDSIAMDQWSRPSYYETQDSPLPCVLSPATARVGSDGVARFDNVTINGTLGEYFQVLVAAEWLTVPLLPQPPALGSFFRVATEVANVKVVELGSFAVQEMQVITPSVAVRDAEGHPVVGRLVVAQIFFEVYSETFADRIFLRKELVDAVSLPTDANGTATWRRLRFSTGGPAGSYQVRFRCDGVSSELVNYTVKTLVGKVLVSSPGAKLPEDRTRTLLLLGQQTVVTINILDDGGGPVQGKLVEMRSVFGRIDIVFAASLPSNAQGVPQCVVAASQAAFTDDSNYVTDEFIVTVDTAESRWPVAVYKVPDDPNRCTSFVSVTIPDFVSAAPFRFVFRALNVLGNPVAGVNATLQMVYSYPFFFDATLVPSDANGTIVATVTRAEGFAQPIFVLLQAVAHSCEGITQLAVFRFAGPRLALTAELTGWINASTARVAVSGGASDVKLVPYSVPVAPSARGQTLFAIAQLSSTLFEVTFSAGARGNFSFFARSLYQCSSEMMLIERPDTVASLTLLTPASDSSQPVVLVRDAGGAPLAGVVVTIVNASLASRSFISSNAQFDDSGVLASAPSDAEGKAVFSGLVFTAAAGRLCFSTRYVDHASLDFNVLEGSKLGPGAYGQNGVMRESAVVCQDLALSTTSLSACVAVTPLPTLASFDSSFGGAVINSCAPGVYSMQATSVRTGARAAVYPSSVFVSVSSSFLLPNLTFVGGEAGDYRLSLGNVSLGTVTLVSEPDALAIKIDAGVFLNGIPAVNGSLVRVGVDAVNVVVQALNGGLPVNGVVLEVTIESGDGEMEKCVNVTRQGAVVSTFVSVQESGVAVLFISLTSTSRQNQPFRFRVASVDRPSVYVVTALIVAVNVVNNVTVFVEPAAGSAAGGRVLVGATDTMVQPVMKLLDVYGDGVEGVAVVPVMVSCFMSDFNETALLEYTPDLSDARGLYGFSDLRVLSARSGQYCMRFGARGMFSSLSPPFEVYDPSSPSLDSFDNLELFLGLSLLAALPMMLFNSRRIRIRWLVVGSFFVALGVMVGVVAYLGGVIATPGFAFGAASDPLVIVQLAVTLAVACLTVIVLLWVGLKACRGKPDFHDTQTEMYKAHVRLLMRPVTDAKLLKEAAKKEQRKRRQVAAGVERKRWAEEPDLSWLQRALRLFWVEAADVLIMARDDYILDITFMDYGKHLRTNLRYSARFLTVLGVGFLSAIVGALACVVIILAVANGLAQAKIALAALEVQTLGAEGGAMLLGGGSLVLSQLQVINATGIAGLLTQALDFAAPLLDGDPSGGTLTDSQRYLSSRVIETMLSRLIVTGAIAGLVAVVYAVVVLCTMCCVYKRQMFAARNGSLYSVQFDRHSQRPTAASELPGIMFSHVLVGILLSFGIFWLLIFAFSFATVRQVAMNSTLKLLLALLTVNIVWGVLHFVFSIVIRKGFYIRDFFLFSLFDFVETYLSIASSAILGLVRILVGAAATVLLFVTPVVPLLGWTPLILIDFSYKAWRGLILNDSIHLNPVVQVAVACFRQPVDRDESPERVRVRRMFWRAVMKARFPQVYDDVMVADVVAPGQHVLAVRVDDPRGKLEEYEAMPLSGESDSDEGRPLIEYSRM